MLEEALIGNSAPDCPLFLAAMAALGMFIGRLGVESRRISNWLNAAQKRPLVSTISVPPERSFESLRQVHFA